MAGYYSATRQHNAAAPLADFCTAAYRLDGQNQLPKVIVGVKFTDGIEAGRENAAA